MGGNNVILTMRKLLGQLESLLYNVSNQKMTEHKFTWIQILYPSLPQNHAAPLDITQLK